VSALHIEAVQGAGHYDPRPWGVYGRISKRKRGDGAGAYVKIERQHSEGAEYVRRRVDPSASFRYYKDNMSAWDPDTYREDWEQMLADCRSGALAGIVGWNTDRYTRQPEQMEKAFSAVAAGRADMHTVQTGQIKSKLTARILTAVAAEESDIKSERLKLKHNVIASEGRPHGGRRRFGYESGMIDRLDPATGEIIPGVRESEAAVIRDIAARVLRGDSLASIARDLNEAGVETAEGGIWRPGNLGRLIRSPHLAGIRVHNGQETDATWDPILDPTTYQNLVDLLTDPKRRTSTSNARVYLLAGLAVCHACGAHLRGRPHYKSGVRSYACLTGRHCHKATDVVDLAVTELVIERLSRMDANGALVDDSAQDEMRDLEKERDGIHRKLAGWTDANLEGRLPDEQLERSSTAAQKRLTAIEEQMKSLRTAIAVPVAALKDMTGPGARDAWKSATLGRRRKIIACLTERVALKGSGRVSREFDPERDLEIKWKEIPA
jgi:DNA invertase Pin-like site-specific DNA recombinase